MRVRPTLKLYLVTSAASNPSQASTTPYLTIHAYLYLHMHMHHAYMRHAACMGTYPLPLYPATSVARLQLPVAGTLSTSTSTCATTCPCGDAIRQRVHVETRSGNVSMKRTTQAKKQLACMHYYSVDAAKPSAGAGMQLEMQQRVFALIHRGLSLFLVLKLHTFLILI